jgi:hypothetical protein
MTEKMWKLMRLDVDLGQVSDFFTQSNVWKISSTGNNTRLTYNITYYNLLQPSAEMRIRPFATHQRASSTDVRLTRDEGGNPFMF